MVRILMPRGTGKSRNLVLASSSNNVPIVTFSNGGVENLKRIAKEMGVTIPDPYALSDFTNDTYFRGRVKPKHVYVDDADCMLSRLFNTNVEAFTMSLDEGEKYYELLTDPKFNHSKDDTVYKESFSTLSLATIKFVELETKGLKDLDLYKDKDKYIVEYKL